MDARKESDESKRLQQRGTGAAEYRKRKKNKHMETQKKKTKGHEGDNNSITTQKDESKRVMSRLTTNAVKSLVNFAHSTSKDTVLLENDILVRLGLDHSAACYWKGRQRDDDRTILATLDDGTYSLPVLLLDDSSNAGLQLCLRDWSQQGSSNSLYWIVAVRGVMTTNGHNPKYQFDPLICLTSVDIVDTCQAGFRPARPYRTHVSSDSISSSPPQQVLSTTGRVRAGSIGSFLHQTLPFLTNDELTLCNDSMVQRFLLKIEDADPEDAGSTAINLASRQAVQVQTFLKHHSAMMTLKQSSQATDHSVESYSRALAEFKDSQLDRQKASLGTNAGREAAERSNLVTTQYHAALAHAMKEPSPNAFSTTVDHIMTSQRLCECHKTLLDQLHAEAGQLRVKPVRAGHTVFCRPKDIASELDKFCSSLTSLKQRLDLASNAWHLVFFAAIAMYGVVDIHPFADGNGRMSRIIANWALAQLPFTINLFATPVQRAEYVHALELTRHLLSLSKTSGAVSKEKALQVTKSIGVFAPVARILMDRIARAIVEFNRVWEEKSNLAAEALEFKAARLARERAKEGTCIICLEETPNIATLCCGKAVHLNCIAEWLSNQNSCPCCRSEMPYINRRVVRAVREDSRGESINQDPRSMHGQMRRREEGDARDVLFNLLFNNNNNNASTETAEDDDDDNDEDYDDAQDTTTRDIEDDDDEESNDSDEGEADDDEESDELFGEDNEEIEPQRQRHQEDLALDEEADDESDELFGEDNAEAERQRQRHQEDFALAERLRQQIEQHWIPTDQEVPGNRNSHPFWESTMPHQFPYHNLNPSNLDYDTTSTVSENQHDDDDQFQPQDETRPYSETEGDTTEIISARVSAGSSSRVYCDALYCRNRPAVDCSNNLCGRCCVLGGEFHCARHNS